MKNKIYFIDADQYYPVGSAGAVVIAKTAKRALELTSGLLKPSNPKCIGTTGKKEGVLFENTTNY